jgi:cysteine synthase A
LGKIYSDITQLIGLTPMVEISRFSAAFSLHKPLFVKIEAFNPGGSVKERIAKAMVEKALKEGLIKEGSTLIEPTSGNTGIGLALVGAAWGFKVIIVMPDTMSVERRSLLKAYGAEVVLTDGAQGMRGAIAKAKELATSIENSFIPSQFTNYANVEIHKKTTGKEIWEDSDGNVDILVCGIGTGGTISGAGAYLKEKNKNIKIVAVEPATSAVLSGNEAGKHKIQGIGAGFIPEILDTSIYDEIVTVNDEEAFISGKLLATSEGILAGISSGGALAAAVKVAQKEENWNKQIVVVLPDHGDRYLSTPLFS